MSGPDYSATQFQYGASADVDQHVNQDFTNMRSQNPAYQNLTNNATNSMAGQYAYGTPNLYRGFNYGNDFNQLTQSNLNNYDWQMQNNPVSFFQNTAQSLMDPTTQANQGITNAGNQTLANSGTMTGLGGQVSGMAGQVAGMAPSVQGMAGQLSKLGSQYTPYINQILQQGFDPQQQLYKQQHQLNTDNSLAQLSAMGLGTSAYGAQAQAQSDQTFNTNWQNTQLGRENQAITGATGLGNTIGSLDTQAGNLYGQAGNLYGQAGGLQNTAASIYGAAGNQAQQGTSILQSMPAQQLAALQAMQGSEGQQQQQLQGYQQGAQQAGAAGMAFSQAPGNYLAQQLQQQQGAWQNQAQDYLSYLSGNTSAVNASNQGALGAAQLQNTQNQQFLGLLGGAAGKLLG